MGIGRVSCQRFHRIRDGLRDCFTRPITQPSIPFLNFLKNFPALVQSFLDGAAVVAGISQLSRSAVLSKEFIRQRRFAGRCHNLLVASVSPIVLSFLRISLTESKSRITISVMVPAVSFMSMIRRVTRPVTTGSWVARNSLRARSASHRAFAMRFPRSLAAFFIRAKYLIIPSVQASARGCVSAC